MPVYVFKCIGPEHKDESSRVFECFFHFRKDKPINVTQSQCPECGFPSPRSIANEGFVTPGLQPITKGYLDAKDSIQHEIKFAFGESKRNPDGSVDDGKMPFASTGEYDKYLKGNNKLGPPVCDDNGQPIRQKDGTFMRTGEKLFKYSGNASPSKSTGSRAPMSAPGGQWVGDGDAGRYSGGPPPNLVAPRVRTRSR